MANGLTSLTISIRRAWQGSNRPGDAFHTQRESNPSRFPIQLTLFSEADLVKILGNAFFNDFDRQQVDFNTDPEDIRKLLSSLQKKRQPQPTGGMDEDDAVDLYDYFEKHFNKRHGTADGRLLAQRDRTCPLSAAG